MPRTIEHKIKIIGSTTPSANISEYGTIERQKNPSNFEYLGHSQGNSNNNTKSHVGIKNYFKNIKMLKGIFY